MPKVCQSGVVREYKKALSDSIHPSSPYWKEDLPRCGGEILFSVEVEGGGCCKGQDYCYCTTPSIRVKANCSECKSPYYEGIYDLTGAKGSWVVNQEIEKVLNA